MDDLEEPQQPTLDALRDEMGISEEDLREFSNSSEAATRLEMSVHVMFNAFEEMKGVATSGIEPTREETLKMYDDLIEAMELTLGAFKDVRAEME